VSAPASPRRSIRVLLSSPAEALGDAPALSVIRAGSAAEIAARLAEEAFDCLVVDLVEAGGAAGLRELRRTAPSAALVALASGQDEVREAVRAGAHRCLPAETLTGPMLAVAVTEAIERRAAGPGAAGGETVRRLARAVEHRDMETSAHVERMSCYCGLLAGHAGLDAELMRVASRLHDLGKVAVPDAILLKPGPLTPAERREMERHAELGGRLLAGSGVEFLDLASEIAWTHHERYDGHGYPRGLAGEDIPLSGRIAALADAFDAVSTDRVYRRALPFAEALAVVREERGRQFDPGLADALLAAPAEVSEIMERHADEPAAQPGAREPELLTLQQAASTLGVSQSRLRRWSDEGRIAAVRTPGGHRRFHLEAVRRLAIELGARPGVRPLGPPAHPLPALSARLAADAAELELAAAAALYRSGHPGWFASPAARGVTADWIDELRQGCASGRYAAALTATDALMRRAYLQGASLLERHGFLERFALACQRALTLAGASREEQAAARRLFAALQQALLASQG
jgi:excisionase family DNA binding protein